MAEPDDRLERHALFRDLEACRGRVEELETELEQREDLLEDLSLHQEELRTQNDELRRAHGELDALQQRYKDLFDLAPVAHFVLDATGAVTEVNLRALKLLGLDRSKILRHPFRLFVRENASRHLFEAFMQRLRRGEAGADPEIELQSRDGRVTPVQLTAQPCHDDANTCIRLSAVDIADRRRADEHHRLAATVFEESNEGIVITDRTGAILRVNQAFTIVTGYQEDEVRGRTPAILASGRHDPTFYQDMWQRLREHGGWRGEIWNQRKNGEIYPEWLGISPVRDPEGEVVYYVGIFSDITEKKRAEVDLEHFAHFDQLTGLPNRVLFQDRLKQAMVRAGRNERHVVLLFLDLDRFKAVNDTLGHQAGDLLLQRAAGRIQRSLRSVDTVSRLGGDEFTVIVGDIESRSQGAEVAAHIADKIAGALGRPFRLGNQEVASGASIGIAIHPEDGATVSDLIKHADTAMYAAKANGGNGCAFFSAEMTASAARRLELEAALRHAVRRREFRVEFQPQVDAVRHRITGAEVLLRWESAALGGVAPDEFIPVLEDMGLMTEVGWWVLRQACEEALHWHRQGFDAFRVAFNFSPRQFRDPECLEQMRHILAESQALGEWLTLEVTEHHMMQNQELSLDILRGVRRMGIRVALDDFGTGHSSLSLLKRFPIDELKIDRGFVQDLPRDEDDAIIVSTIILMARNLGIDIVAEGVEDEQQARQLIELQCPVMQGYHWGRPMSSGALEAWRRGFLSRSPLPGG